MTDSKTVTKKVVSQPVRPNSMPEYRYQVGSSGFQYIPMGNKAPATADKKSRKIDLSRVTLNLT